MQKEKFSFAKFFTGVFESAFNAPMPSSNYPFPLPERALTFDWDNIGSDINSAMLVFEEKNDSRK